MRYFLKNDHSEGEINLKSLHGKAGLKASIEVEGERVERTLVLSKDLIQVKEDDGSLRGLAYNSDSGEGRATRFFHRGRLRTLESVGGVGDSVEGSLSEGTVKAPMNGQVVKVPAKVGEAVECGDIVLILEAMKMENEVTAPIRGTLTELMVSAGQTVSPGQTMFTIESAE